MSPLPAFILACPATLALILRAIAGELPRTGYYDAWESLDDPDSYQPSEEVRLWLHEHWAKLLTASQQPDEAAEAALADIDHTVDLDSISIFSRMSHARAWMGPFLEAFARLGVQSEAAQEVGIDPSTPGKAAKANDQFARNYELARMIVADSYRKEWHARAIEGWDEPVFGRVGKDQDGIIGHIRKKSDSLLARGLVAYCAEFAKQAEGAASTTVNVHNSATASAHASAGVSIPAEEIQGLQASNQRQLERAMQEASRSRATKN